jgi:hypothetical protein
MDFKVKPGKKNNAIMKMVIPGRRALGETWREVTIRPTDNGGYTTENVAAEAPAQGRPVVIPAMANLSDDEVNFILEGALKAQDYYSRQKRKPNSAEEKKIVQKMWDDYVEQKLKGFKGQTVLGPGGFFQRESPGLKNWN